MGLAEYIAQDLERRIRAGEDVPLTRRGLATLYEASVSPVTAALESLLAKGLFVRRANGRLALPDRLPRGRKPARAEKPDALLHEVGRQLVQWSLQGQHRELREEAMASHFGIGRTALRRIFSRHARDGLLEHRPRQGWILRTFAESDLHDFLEVRATLECMALDLARERLEPPVLEDMLAANQPDCAEEDNRLHGYILERAGNRYIQNFFAAQGAFWETLFIWEGEHDETLPQTQAQHCAILEALLSRAWKKAREALRHHILHNHDFLLTRVRAVRSSSN